MKKRYKLTFLAILVIGLLGCADTSATDATEPVSITFFKRGYVEGGDDITSTTNAVAVEMFQQKNPNITVDIVGIPWSAEGDARLENAIAGEEKINVFSVRPGELIQFSQQGKVSSIEPFLTDEDKSDFYASGFQAATVDGKVLAWPIWVTAISIFANTEMFEARGVDLPSMENLWTWDEFVAVSKQLTFTDDSGSSVYGFTASSKWWAVDYYPVFYIDGGRILSPDGKRFVQNQPEAISGLQKVADLRQVHQVTPADFGTVEQLVAQAQFKNGEVAMLMSTPAFIGELEEEKFPLAVLPIPTGELGQLVTTGGFGMYAVADVADRAELEAAHTFAKYITGSQVAKDVPGYQLAPGLRRSNTNYATTPNREIITKLVEFGVYEAPAAISTELGNQYGEALKSIVLGEKTPQQAMDDIALVYQAELDASYR